LYGTGVIPMAIYKNNCGTQTLTVGTQLVVTDKVSEDLAFRMNQAFWHKNTMNAVRESHPKGLAIEPESAQRSTH
jgi:TRAP-type uncharacterized transport system substrate-binding protein